MTQLTTGELLRLAVFLLLGIPFGILAVWASQWWHQDYGLPWRRRPGSNGRSVVDGLVTVVFGAIAAVVGFGTLAGFFRGTVWIIWTTNTLFLLMIVFAWALVVAVWRERRKRRRMQNAEH